MTAPSIFDMTRAISNNVGRGAQTARDENAIERILSQASQSGNPQVLQDSIGKILSQVSPERQGPAMQYLQNITANIQQKQEKAKAEAQGRTAAQQAGVTYGLHPTAQAQQLRNMQLAKPDKKLEGNRKTIEAIEDQRGMPRGSLAGFENNPNLAASISKPKEIKPTPKSEADKLLEKETAKGYIEAHKELPKLEASIQNIGRLRELGKNLVGFGGYFKSALNTASASEYNTLGASLLEPIIKVFNPVGAVPTSKLQWIRDTFAPKANDLQSTQEGKISTLERLANQAVERAKKKIKLFEDYKGEPPASEVLNFDNESSKIITDFVDNQQYVNQLKKELPEGKILMIDPSGKPLHVDPNAKAPDGRSIKDYYIELGARLVNE